MHSLLFITSNQSEVFSKNEKTLQIIIIIIITTIDIVIIIIVINRFFYVAGSLSNISCLKVFNLKLL